jgi:tetratricopeptide (TPR) repeat protein
VANLQLGRYGEAERYFEQGLALCLELGDRRNAGAMFSNLGESARLRGDYSSAVSLYQKALEIAREIGNRSSEMIYLCNLGGARLGLKQFQEAEHDLRQAIAMTGMAKSCGLSETYTFLAQACFGQNKLAEALDAAQQAIAIAMQTENPFELAGGWRATGQVLAALEQSGPAHKRSLRFGHSEVDCDSGHCFAESIRLYEAIGAVDEQARTSQMWTACRQPV